MIWGEVSWKQLNIYSLICIHKCVIGFIVAMCLFNPFGPGKFEKFNFCDSKICFNLEQQ